MSKTHELWERLKDLHCFAGYCTEPVSALVLTDESIFCLCSKCAPQYKGYGAVVTFDELRKVAA